MRGQIKRVEAGKRSRQEFFLKWPQEAAGEFPPTHRLLHLQNLGWDLHSFNRPSSVPGPGLGIRILVYRKTGIQRA